MGCNDAARILRILPVFREADGACRILNADKHSPASSARSDCVHEQVAKRIANVRFTVRFARSGITPAYSFAQLKQGTCLIRLNGREDHKEKERSII